MLSKIDPKHLTVIGITNQRETVVMWDTQTGEPLHRAIVWQCRRTTQFCQNLKEYQPLIKQKTGLFLDPYFSASKIKWLLDNSPAVKSALTDNRLACGTIDSFITYKLTNNKQHVTDASNASRTMLFNIHTGQYDQELLDLFGIPAHILPNVMDSNALFGYSDPTITGSERPIHAILGDQQAALYFHQLDNTLLKNTYGTGLFLMGYTGDQVCATNSLINTVAWQCDGKLEYSLEGSAFIGGAAIQWLRDGLNVIQSAKDVEAIAEKVDDTNGVVVVPAFTGLGAPYWNPHARGMITGITRDTRMEHIIKATLDSIAYQTCDIIDLMTHADERLVRSGLSVDGGASANNLLMQFQSDLLQLPIKRPSEIQATALGVGVLAGQQVNVFSALDLTQVKGRQDIFTPNKDLQHDYQLWKNAIRQANIN